MNKIKILAFIAFTAIFSACGPDDGSPPSLKTTQRGFISPFDILEAEFDSKIVNVKDLQPSDISSSTKMELLSDDELTKLGIKKSDKILYFRGSYSTTPGGLPYFAGGLENAYVTFRNLKNSDYKRDSTTLYFSTYPILDSLNGNNDIPGRAIDLEPFLAIKYPNPISFAGVLDHESDAGVNFRDYYKLSLRTNDSLKILAKSNDTLIINITEPGKNSVDKTCGVSPKKETSCDLTVGIGHLDVPQGDPSNKLVDFYIKISDGKSEAQPNPYTLIITRVRIGG